MPKPDSTSHWSHSERYSGCLSGVGVLVLEDESMIAFDLASSLEQCSARIIGPVPTVAGARQAILDETSGVDAAIIDINLQGKMSFEIAELLQGLRIPFIFTSGYSREQIPDAFADVPLCVKPLEAPSVIKILASLLSRRI